MNTNSNFDNLYLAYTNLRNQFVADMEVFFPDFKNEVAKNHKECDFYISDESTQDDIIWEFKSPEQRFLEFEINRAYEAEERELSQKLQDVFNKYFVSKPSEYRGFGEGDLIEY